MSTSEPAAPADDRADLVQDAQPQGNDHHQGGDAEQDDRQDKHGDQDLDEAGALLASRIELMASHDRGLRIPLLDRQRSLRCPRSSR